MLTYVEVFAEGAENDWSFLAFGEEQNLWLSWVVLLEDVMVLFIDLNGSVSNVSEGQLLQLVSVEAF